MTEAELVAQQERWERKESALLRALPYFLLAVGTLIALLQPLWGMPDRSTLVISLTVLAVGWIAVLHTTHPQWRTRRGLMGVYYAGLMVLATALVVVSPWYGVFSFIGYIQAMEVLVGRWQILGVVVTAALAGTSQIGGVANINDRTWWAWLVLVVFNALVAGTFAYSGEQSEQRTRRQRRALTELGEANAKLEAALEENAALHAQLLVQAREAGVHDERQRMAREIHDTLAQGLAGILTQLQAAQQAYDQRAEWQRHVETASALARESLTEARRSVHAVEPAALEQARLPDAIGEVVRNWTSTHEVPAVLTTTGDARPMHPEVEVTLLRAAQEALANVAKHARATRVGLTLSYMEDLVTLDVRDDGVGFEPNGRRASAPASATGGFGLTGMRQRVQRLAGRLEIESEPGGGTAVSATVPAIPAEGAR
ncbi:sensor histidine kinase [Actinophytocola xanthii]|uniref:Oxygen sensor histidine kinase NreB n=1 Tax=Actinophytocola xanthii TaxID=1912961 RepID=A0A1Q8CL33_9PSEU|nr:sensor histidine kinase [Actinophytocola xanthii]OLF15064.1 two-component sensor histidine kinase [Actinophytocola xanthii]